MILLYKIILFNLRSNLLKNYLDNEISSLIDLLSIESTCSEKKTGMPFGESIFNALTYMLKLGSSFGFETFNDNGYAGHIDFGYGDDIFGILCHLDVVPAGKFWTYPAFKGTLKDDKIYGRGALDNKGPAIAVLYAMKKLYDDGFVPKKKLRLILGCNEESGWKCMEHYDKTVGIPKNGFSPDADFPVINAEKGVLHLDIIFDNTCKSLIKLKGGNKVNMVADSCDFIFDNNEYNFEGLSAHGSAPDKGISAIFPAFDKLVTLTDDTTIKTIYKYLIKNSDGKKLELCISDKISGKLSLNFGTIELLDNKIICGVDIRFPIEFTKDYVLDKLKITNAEVVIKNYHKPLYVDENCELIKNLLSAYKKVTGKDGKCISIGGATYARTMENGVAFGPVFPGEISTIHEADEYISVDNLLKITQIYYEALKLF